MGLQTPRKVSRQLSMRFLTIESDNINSAEQMNVKERRKLELRWSDMERRHSCSMRSLSHESFQMKRELTQLLETKKKIHRQRSASVVGTSPTAADKRAYFLDGQRRASEAVTAWYAKIDAQNQKDKSEQTRKYSLDNLRNDVTIDEIKRPQRSSLKSAPASHHFRYKLSPNLNRDERKKSVTFTCDIKDSNVSEHRAKELIETIEKCDTEGDCHNDNDEYIAEFMRANNLHKTSNSNENKFASNEHMYSQEGPKRLSKRKASIPTNDDVKKEGTASETEQRECCSEELKTLHRKSAEYKINNTEDCTETNGNNSEQNDHKVADENNADDEGIYNNGKPVRLARRNTVASVSSSMKKLSLGNNLTERNQQRKASAPPGIGRKRKSAVFALDPEFHAQLEKQNEERFQKEKLLERRKTEPTIVLCNSLTDSDDTPTFADLNESRKEETNMTEEERNSNSINALYSAKNKISNILYITKGKMSNRPETSSEEQKAKPLVRGIPYHSEMRMKRRGTISLHLKSIYLDDAERKIKSKRKSSTENNVFVRK